MSCISDYLKAPRERLPGYFMLCRSSVISSALPHPRLAGVPSLTFSAVAIQSLKDKGRVWGLMGTAQLISSAYSVTCPAISHPTFPLHITHFHLETLSILILSQFLDLDVGYYKQTASEILKILHLLVSLGPFVLLSYTKSGEI